MAGPTPLIIRTDIELLRFSVHWLPLGDQKVFLHYSSIFILLVCILVVGKMCAMWKISLAFNIHRHHLLTSIYTGPHLLTSIYIHRHIPVDLLYDGYFVEVEDEPWQVTHGEHRDDQHQHH